MPDGLRILLVEDEVLIGLDLATALEGWGHQVTGPLRTVAAALASLSARQPDLAILDVTLRDGEASFPIADALAARGVPHLFLTGYASGGLPGLERLAGVPRLPKPVDYDALRVLIEDMHQAESLSTREG